MLNPIKTEFKVKLDESKDDEIAEMSKEEVLDRVCNWNGLIGYGSTIKQWIEDIYGVNLEDE